MTGGFRIFDGGIEWVILWEGVIVNFKVNKMEEHENVGMREGVVGHALPCK